MPITTDLSVSPYFDDYEPDLKYYKTLFKPSTAVQVRELNQLQTVLQEQIARFGDHILKRGTILEGCEAQFEEELAYIKINDLTNEFQAAVDVESYEGLLIKSVSTGKVAEVVNSREGYEAQDPNLSTLYLDYKDDGTNGDQATFLSGQILQVFNPDLRLYGFQVVNPSQGYSNSDTVIITSAIEVQNSTGGIDFAGGDFVVGNQLTMDDNGAVANIIAIDTTSNTDAIVLTIEPIATNLTPIPQTSSWVYNTNTAFTTTGTVSTIDATIVGKVGENASARITTTTAGAINKIDLLTPGENYYVAPNVKIASTSATVSQSNLLDIVARPYLASVTVSSLSDSVGVAYGMSITEGMIYQKGYFLTVDPQSIIVAASDADFYSNTPDEVAVGFDTAEFIVNSGIDESLYDNAEGFLNQNAPGADRLKLVPALVVKTLEESDADEEFLPIFKFSEGKPYAQQTTTAYSKLDEELSQRTYDIAGDFVLDPFDMTSRSTLDMEDTCEEFTYVIDPGYAYINGRRVKTDRQYATDVPKAKDTDTETTVIDASYGNYIRVNNLGGVFATDRCQQIQLYGGANGFEYLSDLNSDLDAFVTGSGLNSIGTARIRSFQLESGVMGSPQAIYRAFLYDVRMNIGKNFYKDVKAIRANESTDLDGIADVILEAKSGSSPPGVAITPGAIIYAPNENYLVFDQELPMKSITGVAYNYKTLARDVITATNGTASVALEAGSEWPYTGDLTLGQLTDLLIVPQEDMIAASPLPDTFTASAGATTLTFVGGAGNKLTELSPGDYIYLDDSVDADVEWVRVERVKSATQVIVSPALTNTYSASSTASKGYPKAVAVPIVTDPDITATVSGTITTGTLDLDLNITMSATKTIAVYHTQRVSNQASRTKTSLRQQMVRINVTKTVNGGILGPWSLGVSDAYRLRHVYQGTDALPPDASGSYADVVDNFYIENNQTPSQLKLSQLVLDPKAKETNGYEIPQDAEWLVVFDYFELAASGSDVKTISSYMIGDCETLTELTTGANVHTLELPEINEGDGNYYDVREIIDFRPSVAKIFTPTADSATAPCIDALPNLESDGVTIPDPANLYGGADFKIPVPDGDITFTSEYYLPRSDVMLLNQDGEFEVLHDTDIPRESPTQLYLFEATVPPYPSLPENLSPDEQEILDTNTFSQKTSYTRPGRYTISMSAAEEQYEGYTMAEIAQLERRIEVLEYYALLSETENDVKNQSISSSIDKTIERFKFGFFVDDFTSYDYTDSEAMSHNSTIFGNKLTAARKSMDIEFQPSQRTLTDFGENYNITPKYTTKTILSQKKVTDGPVIPPRPPSTNTTIIVYNPPPPPVTVERCLTRRNQTTKYDRNGTFGEDTIIRMAGSSAYGSNIEIFFDVLGGRDRIEVYQATANLPPDSSAWQLIASNSDTSLLSNLTDAERREKGKDLSFFTRRSVPYTLSSGPSGQVNYWLRNQGKMTVPYNSGGTYIRIRVVKASPAHGYVVCYKGISFLAETTSTIKLPVKPPVVRVPTPVRPPKQPTKKTTPIKITPPVKKRPPIVVCRPPKIQPVRCVPPRPPRPPVCPPPPPKVTHDPGIRLGRGCVKPRIDDPFVIPRKDNPTPALPRQTPGKIIKKQDGTKNIIKRSPPPIRAPIKLVKPKVPKPPTTIRTGSTNVAKRKVTSSPAPNKLIRAVNIVRTPVRSMGTPVSKPAPRKTSTKRPYITLG